jgi:hypothetical protein
MAVLVVAIKTPYVFLRAAQPGDFPHANLGPLAAVQRAV